MSDDGWIGAVVAAVIITLILTVGIGVSRSNRQEEESFRACVSAGGNPYACRGKFVEREAGK